jgi:chromate transporter
MSLMNDLIELFLTFAKVGAFTFGGGYAMISLIEDICVEKKKWITHDEMMDITVIAESTPGPIAINCATYVGYKRKKLLGAIFATIGMVLPSFVIIFLISKYLDRFLEISWIDCMIFCGCKINFQFYIHR